MAIALSSQKGSLPLALVRYLVEEEEKQSRQGSLAMYAKLPYIYGLRTEIQADCLLPVSLWAGKIMIYSSALNFTTVFDLLGTFAFAISGIRWASTKKFDWFGAYVVGLVTAIGGGTTRDLLLNSTPFWMENASYLTVTGLALLATLLFRNGLTRWGRALFLFDSIGLGLFTVAGIGKSLDAGFPFWVCIMMGAITGSVGGVIRDVLINETPLLFRKDIYALASIAGGLIYMICYDSGLPASMTELLAVLTVISIRVIAVRFHVRLPFLEPIDTEHDDQKGKK